MFDLIKQLTAAYGPSGRETEIADVIETLCAPYAQCSRDALGNVIAHKPGSGKRVMITVADQGRGIPEEELSKITEPFYMVDKSRSRAEGGAGLGLALCKQIAELHQGSLQFESAVGAGTTVTVTLGGAANG